ncbi:hypothetical protein BO85DRAFT_127925 [Aspergillus piperis CBS 112811]|uniref:Uncharacterized protein n=6 Tax=Aspergillus subgen. Circumdati TaxID=2720871 RepID=A0A1L9NC15_ASPTC|nr:uncharacterized protein BO83DRAFT_242890 [Aspergillus eucalypticola CBS 122712]XP_025484934.1 hypothetical protein BO87DRAFT_83170 [Aspergillus neoniger CBS 115656]XP_025520090.1 hypothetical protein BO85DRAFT_127925 [Aspergillus piperis CBS 112811]XP_025567906.1 hypothetical protein BO88DRAFT_3309 [Aspergillus vadensis CBS 113365]OJI86820.1 hypothetical protein ASPTUDRAFT_494910 [Aspergillus tubingensis CBS 134.48]OJZ92390.1 hypothetical protein ASPFODRAFT_259193 [Aspergillus luchuensis CB
MMIRPSQPSRWIRMADLAAALSPYGCTQDKHPPCRWYAFSPRPLGPYRHCSSAEESLLYMILFASLLFLFHLHPSLSHHPPLPSSSGDNCLQVTPIGCLPVFVSE